MKKIKIAVADDQVLFRKSFITLLLSFKNIIVSIEAGNGKELLDLLGKTDQLPDIIFLDIRMPEMDGMIALEQLKKNYGQIKIIMLSVLDENRFVSHVIAQGASGYLLKDSEPDEVVKAINEIVKKGYYFNDKAIAAMQEKLLNPKKASLLEHGIELSNREKEILLLICQEFTMSEIAEKLFISLRTVEKHRDNIISKTGVRNTAGLVLSAVKNKLVSLD